MDFKKCNMCKKDLKSAFSPSSHNEGKEPVKSFVEIRVMNNFKTYEESFKLLELCESCHYRLLDFIEHSISIFTTASDEEAQCEQKVKWWPKFKKNKNK